VVVLLVVGVVALVLRVTLLAAIFVVGEVLRQGLHRAILANPATMLLVTLVSELVALMAVVIVLHVRHYDE
jgi:uncharacterized membrane protein